jgi:hypothetical protein
LNLSLLLYDSVHMPCDPRHTRALPQEQYDLVVEILQGSHLLEASEVQRLGEVLLKIPRFSARGRELGVDADELAKTISGYGFVEKLHLVDAAELRATPSARIGTR